jgi:YjbE family integral membrane protein
MGLDLDLLSRVLGIVVINLVLSGDNAVVIGLAARRLVSRQRRQAVIWGGLGAIGLRFLFTAPAALALGVPLLRFLGGLVLVWIAFRLLREEDAGPRAGRVREGRSLFDAVRTIVLADVIMSLDNVLAVGAVSQGNVALLLFGLGVSMPLILLSGGVLSTLMSRLVWLTYVGAGVLAWTAAEMMVADAAIGRYLPHAGTTVEPFPAAVTAGTVLLALLLNRREAEASAEC